MMGRTKSVKGKRVIKKLRTCKAMSNEKQVLTCNDPTPNKEQNLPPNKTSNSGNLNSLDSIKISNTDVNLSLHKSNINLLSLPSSKAHFICNVNPEFAKGKINSPTTSYVGNTSVIDNSNIYLPMVGNNNPESESLYKSHKTYKRGNPKVEILPTYQKVESKTKFGLFREKELLQKDVPNCSLGISPHQNIKIVTTPVSKEKKNPSVSNANVFLTKFHPSMVKVISTNQKTNEKLINECNVYNNKTGVKTVFSADNCQTAVHHNKESNKEFRRKQLIKGTDNNSINTMKPIEKGKSTFVKGDQEMAGIIQEISKFNSSCKLQFPRNSPNKNVSSIETSRPTLMETKASFNTPTNASLFYVGKSANFSGNILQKTNVQKVPEDMKKQLEIPITLPKHINLKNLTITSRDQKVFQNNSSSNKNSAFYGKSEEVKLLKSDNTEGELQAKVIYQRASDKRNMLSIKPVISTKEAKIVQEKYTLPISIQMYDKQKSTECSSRLEIPLKFQAPQNNIELSPALLDPQLLSNRELSVSMASSSTVKLKQMPKENVTITPIIQSTDRIDKSNKKIFYTSPGKQSSTVKESVPKYLSSLSNPTTIIEVTNTTPRNIVPIVEKVLKQTNINHPRTENISFAKNHNLVSKDEKTNPNLKRDYSQYSSVHNERETEHIQHDVKKLKQSPIKQSIPISSNSNNLSSTKGSVIFTKTPPDIKGQNTVHANLVAMSNVQNSSDVNSNRNIFPAKRGQPNKSTKSISNKSQILMLKKNAFNSNLIHYKRSSLNSPKSTKAELKMQTKVENVTVARNIPDFKSSVSSDYHVTVIQTDKEKVSHKQIESEMSTKLLQNINNTCKQLQSKIELKSPSNPQAMPISTQNTPYPMKIAKIILTKVDSSDFVLSPEFSNLILPHECKNINLLSKQKFHAGISNSLGTTPSTSSKAENFPTSSTDTTKTFVTPNNSLLMSVSPCESTHDQNLYKDNVSLQNLKNAANESLLEIDKDILQNSNKNIVSQPETEATPCINCETGFEHSKNEINESLAEQNDSKYMSKRNRWKKMIKPVKVPIPQIKRKHPFKRNRGRPKKIIKISEVMKEIKMTDAVNITDKANKVEARSSESDSVILVLKPESTMSNKLSIPVHLKDLPVIKLSENAFKNGYVIIKYSRKNSENSISKIPFIFSTPTDTPHSTTTETKNQVGQITMEQNMKLSDSCNCDEYFKDNKNEENKIKEYSEKLLKHISSKKESLHKDKDLCSLKEGSSIQSLKQTSSPKRLTTFSQYKPVLHELNSSGNSDHSTVTTPSKSSKSALDKFLQKTECLIEGTSDKSFKNTSKLDNDSPVFKILDASELSKKIGANASPINTSLSPSSVTCTSKNFTSFSPENTKKIQNFLKKLNLTTEKEDSFQEKSLSVTSNNTLQESKVGYSQTSNKEEANVTTKIQTTPQECKRKPKAIALDTSLESNNISFQEVTNEPQDASEIKTSEPEVIIPQKCGRKRKANSNVKCLSSRIDYRGAQNINENPSNLDMKTKNVSKIKATPCKRARKSKRKIISVKLDSVRTLRKRGKKPKNFRDPLNNQQHNLNLKSAKLSKTVETPRRRGRKPRVVSKTIEQNQQDISLIKQKRKALLDSKLSYSKYFTQSALRDHNSAVNILKDIIEKTDNEVQHTISVAVPVRGAKPNAAMKKVSFILGSKTLNALKMKAFVCPPESPHYAHFLHSPIPNAVNKLLPKDFPAFSQSPVVTNNQKVSPETSPSGVPIISFSPALKSSQLPTPPSTATNKLLPNERAPLFQSKTSLRGKRVSAKKSFMNSALPLHSKEISLSSNLKKQTISKKSVSPKKGMHLVEAYRLIQAYQPTSLHPTVGNLADIKDDF